MASIKKEGFRVAIPTEKIIMSREQIPVDQLNAKIPAVIAAFNQALAALQALDLGEFSLADVTAAIQGSKTLEDQVRSRVSENKPVKIGNMVFSAEKVKSMVEIPDLTNADAQLANLKRELEQARNTVGRYLEYVMVLANFEINGFTATFSQTALDKFVDQNSVYAESDGEKELVLIINEIVENLKYLGDKYKLHPINHQVIEQNQPIAGVAVLKVNYTKIKRYMDHFEGRNLNPFSW